MQSDFNHSEPDMAKKYFELAKKYYHPATLLEAERLINNIGRRTYLSLTQIFQRQNTRYLMSIQLAILLNQIRSKIRLVILTTPIDVVWGFQSIGKQETIVDETMIEVRNEIMNIAMFLSKTSLTQ